MTTDLYALFGTDEDIEREGFWYVFSKEKTDDDGNVIEQATKFLLARAGGANLNFAKALESKTRPYRRQIDNESLDNELANDLLREAFVEAVLLNWTGVKDRNKNDLPYSKENAAKLLKDLPDLYLELRGEATRLSNFRAKEIEDDTGN